MLFEVDGTGPRLGRGDRTPRRAGCEALLRQDPSSSSPWLELGEAFSIKIDNNSNDNNGKSKNTDNNRSNNSNKNSNYDDNNNNKNDDNNCNNNNKNKPGVFPQCKLTNASNPLHRLSRSYIARGPM